MSGNIYVFNQGNSLIYMQMTRAVRQLDLRRFELNDDWNGEKQDMNNACLIIELEWCLYTPEKEFTIGSDKGLLPGRRQALIWTNAGLLLTGPLWTYFSEFRIKIRQFPFKIIDL